MTTDVDPKNLETATLAGGCYWGMQEQFNNKKLFPGVVSSRVGFMGGKDPSLFLDKDGNITEPTREQYLEVKKGNTGFAEVVEIQFDKTKTSYWDILSRFFNIHDPRTENRQGVDHGTQYRSEIFTHSPEQEKLAKLAIQAGEASGLWKLDEQDIADKVASEKFTTKISPASEFYAAYKDHQNYLGQTDEHGNLVNHDDDFCHFPHPDRKLPATQEAAEQLVAEQARGASQSFVNRVSQPKRTLELAF